MDLHTRGYTITLALWFHICTAAQACKSTFLVWPDANTAPDASARNPRPLLLLFPTDTLCLYCLRPGASQLHAHGSELQI